MKRAVNNEELMKSVMEPIQSDGILVFPSRGLEATLFKTIIPSVKERLANITAENVRAQRDYIENVLKTSEEKKVYTHETAVVAKLNELRDVALVAFVRSFEVAPAHGSDLVKFCREYLPEPREKKPKIKSKALITAIQKLSPVGQENIQKTIDSISSRAPTERNAADRITTQFPKGSGTQSSSAAAKGIKIADLDSLSTQIDYEALEKQFSQATSNDKNKIISRLAQRLLALNNNSDQSPDEKSSALKTLTRLIVQELNTGRATESKISQLALIIEEASKNPGSALSKIALVQLQDLGKESYLGVLRRLKTSSKETFSVRQQKLFTETLTKLFPDKFS